MWRMLPSFLVGLLLLIPNVTFAAEATFFGPIVPPECNCEAVISESGNTVPSAADWGCVLQVVQNSINFLVSASVLLVVIFVVLAGITFMTSGTNAHARESARKRIGNAVVGLLVVLAAWLVVDFIMKAIYNPDTQVNGNAIGPWNAILNKGTTPTCIVPKKSANPFAPVTVNPVGGGSDGSATGGRCTAPTGGPCSVASLQNTCFRSVANQAAQICSKESSNNPTKRSQTDRTVDGYAYSVGLFQINLTNSFSPNVNGRSCSDAFTGPCQGSAVVQSGPNIGRCNVRVRDVGLYNACVQAATRVATNISVACSLYDGDWGRWRYSAGQCSLPR